MGRFLDVGMWPAEYSAGSRTSMRWGGGVLEEGRRALTCWDQLREWGRLEESSVRLRRCRILVERRSWSCTGYVVAVPGRFGHGMESLLWHGCVVCATPMEGLRPSWIKTAAVRIAKMPVVMPWLEEIA